jgi:hypothetical protein
VSDIYIAESKTNEYIVVDVLRDVTNSNKFIYRYYLDPAKRVTEQVWNGHDLSGNLNAGTISSCLGKKSSQLVEGIYTMGSINSKTELIYTPLYNPFNPVIAANPTRLEIPSGASAMAVAQNSSEGTTGLFVSGHKILYYFPYNKQEDGEAGQVILTNDLFLNVTQLFANTLNTEVSIWGLNKQGQIFYTKCTIGQETNPASWSTPIPILTNVSQIATYLNNKSSNNVIFAHTNGTDLVKLTQNPKTSIWEKRNITLPSTDMNNVHSLNTYTTHIQLYKEDNLIASNQKVKITSISPVSVYINHEYTILSDAAYELITDATGTITIVQETEKIGAVCYKLQVGGSSEVVDVNPMSKMMETMEGIKSGKDLSNVIITNEDGTTKPLVSASIPEDHKEAAAQAIQQFVAASKSVPQDGSKAKEIKEEPSHIIGPSLKRESMSVFWGMSFKGGNIAYHVGQEAVKEFGFMIGNFIDAPKKNPLNITGVIKAEAGDIFNYLKHTLNEVKNFYVEVFNGVYNFVIKIGEKVYKFALDCYQAIANAIEFVFNKLKVFIEDLKKWVGFVFKWQDILRTHKVLKNVLKRGIENSIQEIDNLKPQISTLFEGIKDIVDKLAGLEDIEGNLSNISKEGGTCPGKDDPQANYGVYHLNNGIEQATTKANVVNHVSSKLQKLLNTLKKLLDGQAAIFSGAYDTFQREVIDQIETLSIGEIIKKSVGVILKILIETAENIIITAIDIIKILIEGVMEILEAKIEIPVLSWLYKKITGNDLSFLDLTCFVVAVPTTIIYKILKNKAPFPDNAITTKLINARSWSELKIIINPPPEPPLTQLYYKSSPMMLGPQEGSSPMVSGTQGGSSAYGSELLLKDFIAVSHLVAAISSSIFIVLSIKKKAISTDKNISITHGCFFFSTTFPNFTVGLIRNSDQLERDDIRGNIVLYSFTSVLKLADIFTYKPEINECWSVWSKWLDLIGGGVGLYLTYCSLKNNNASVRSVTGAITNTCWNANRITSPFTENPKVFTAKMVLIGSYGVGQLALFVIPK